jgi:hypothetical protein
MLDSDAERVPTVAQLGQLPCLVRLPSVLENEFDLRGISPSLPGCNRRFPRRRCRGKGSIVALEYCQTLPRLPRTKAWFAVYLTDLGRGGIGLLHGELLYPKERFRIMLPDGTQRRIQIVRCERIDDRCYGIGACFVEPQPAAGEAGT